MTITRKFAVRVTTLLMLTALAIMPLVPAGASPEWDWIPGKTHYNCVGSSNRTISICSYPTDSVVTNKTIGYAYQQGYDMVFSEPWAGGALVNITVPKDSYHSEPFFLKVSNIPGTPPTPVYIWCQVYLVAAGTGTLDIAGGNLDVDVSINVTGHGDGTFHHNMTPGDGSYDPAGSCLLYMPLHMRVYQGASSTTLEPKSLLFDMDFPMWTTTGFAEARIIDPSPFPPFNFTGQDEPASISMDGFYMNTTGVPFNATTGAATLVAAGPLLDTYALLMGILPTWSDTIFTDFEVLEQAPPVGGVWIPVDKLALLAPYIGLASTIILAVAATAIFFKYRKKL